MEQAEQHKGCRGGVARRSGGELLHAVQKRQHTQHGPRRIEARVHEIAHALPQGVGRQQHLQAQQRRREQQLQLPAQKRQKLQRELPVAHEQKLHQHQKSADRQAGAPPAEPGAAQLQGLLRRGRLRLRLRPLDDLHGPLFCLRLRRGSTALRPRRTPVRHGTEHMHALLLRPRRRRLRLHRLGFRLRFRFRDRFRRLFRRRFGHRFGRRFGDGLRCRLLRRAEFGHDLLERIFRLWLSRELHVIRLFRLTVIHGLSSLSNGLIQQHGGGRRGIQG